jgi:hypothetical protein
VSGQFIAHGNKKKFALLLAAVLAIGALSVNYAFAARPPMASEVTVTPLTANARSGLAAFQVRVHPPVVRLGEEATITASGIHAASVEVRLSGGTDPAGQPLPWMPLRLAAATWHGTLPAPALRGVYPVEFRTAADASPLRPARVFLRVFAHGTQSRPAFDNPIDVVRWWVGTVPRATLVALKPWPRPASDRRDFRMHRLFVVAYSPAGRPAVDDRLGIFVTAFRDGYRGPWRLLEATVQP